MSIPKELDEQILNRFDELIEEGNNINHRYGESRAFPHRRVLQFYDGSAYASFRTGTKNLLSRLLDGPGFQQALKDIEEYEGRNEFKFAPYAIVGMLKTYKVDYESGMLDDLSRMIEATVSYDFMGQAEQLLDGEKPDYDHVPAAVLAGAVLENGLRRLCQRQEPPIATKWEEGKPKRLNSLIDALQGKAFTPAKGHQLRSWANIRNSAGHGEIQNFTRADVEDMIAGIKRFLAEYNL
ncbi:MAG: hypothetical protein OXF32_03580 [Anaerolineaceae bacterium]|nr:hypothetical protein [Anaerolineaceae bacterium]